MAMVSAKAPTTAVNEPDSGDFPFELPSSGAIIDVDSSQKVILALYYYDTATYNRQVVDTAFLDPYWVNYMVTDEFKSRVKASVSDDLSTVAVATIVAWKIQGELKLITVPTIRMQFGVSNKLVSDVLTSSSNTTITIEQPDEGIALDGVKLIAVGNNIEPDTVYPKRIRELENLYFTLGEFREGKFDSNLFSTESTIDYDPVTGQFTLNLTWDSYKLYNLTLRHDKATFDRILSSKIGLLIPVAATDDMFIPQGLDYFKQEPGTAGKFVFGDNDDLTMVPIDTIILSERLIAGIADMLPDNGTLPICNLIPYVSDSIVRLYPEPLLEWRIIPVTNQGGIYKSYPVQFIPHEILVVGIQNLGDIVDYNEAPFGSFTDLPNTIELVGRGSLYSNSIMSTEGVVGEVNLVDGNREIVFTPEYSQKLAETDLTIAALVVEPMTFDQGGGI